MANAGQVSRLKAGAEALRTVKGKPSEELEVAAPDLNCFQASGDLDAHDPAPLTVIIQRLARMRAQGRLLQVEEWIAYTKASSISGRYVFNLAVCDAKQGR